MLLKWRLAALLAMMFTRLVLLARLVRLLMVPLIVVAGHEGLLLLRDESRLLAEVRKTLILVAVLRDHLGVGPGLRLVLAELLLRGSNQAEVMLGMLIIIFRGDRIPGTLCVTG